jgi:hypothetical protein
VDERERESVCVFYGCEFAACLCALAMPMFCLFVFLIGYIVDCVLDVFVIDWIKHIIEIWSAGSVSVLSFPALFIVQQSKVQKPRVYNWV